jgi:hypothetical protein
LDAGGLVVETESDSESDSDIAGATIQHPVLLLDEHSDAADKVYRVTHSANSTRTEVIAMGKPTFDAAPHLSTGDADSFEIPEIPLVTEKMQCLVHPSVVRVMGKRLYAERPRYLVLCWMHPPEDEAAHSDLDHHFREYDERISRDLARQERLSTLRSRKQLKLRTEGISDDNRNYLWVQVQLDPRSRDTYSAGLSSTTFSATRLLGPGTRDIIVRRGP